MRIENVNKVLFPTAARIVTCGKGSKRRVINTITSGCEMDKSHPDLIFTKF
jgi:hypothetical protein